MGKKGQNTVKQQAKNAAEQKRAAFDAAWDARVRDHIMLGEMKAGVPAGMHSIQCLGDGNVLMPVGEPIAQYQYGCYKQKVMSVQGTGKSKESTFFPDNWDEPTIKAKVWDAFQHRLQGSASVGEVLTNPGAGLKIIFKYEGNDLVSAFPHFD